MESESTKGKRKYEVSEIEVSYPIGITIITKAFKVIDFEGFFGSIKN